MTVRRFRPMTALALLTGLIAIALPFAPAEAQWVFLARRALGRIHPMTEGGQPGSSQPGYDVASVILDAPADRVFSTALEIARKNRAVRILMQDPAQRRFQVAEGDRTATLHVVPFSDDVSQLFIAGHAGPGEGSISSQVVEAVLRVCREMGKQCEVGG